jgi:hypothetical protein
MRRLGGLLVLIAVLAALLVGCGGDATTTVVPPPIPKHVDYALFERTYVVAAVDPSSGSDPFEEDDRVEVAFGRSHIAPDKFRRSIGWEANCNGMGGALKITPNRLRISEAGSTLVGCGDQPEEEDEWLMNFFGTDPYWRARASRLTLITPLGSMTLRPGV